MKAFEAKRTPWLAREGFTDPFAGSSEGDSFLDIPDNTVYFGNKYMHVYAVNSGDFKEHRQRRLYVDHYEERP